jgi:hypothetical protein
MMLENYEGFENILYSELCHSCILYLLDSSVSSITVLDSNCCFFRALFLLLLMPSKTI